MGTLIQNVSDIIQNAIGIKWYFQISALLLLFVIFYWIRHRQRLKKKAQICAMEAEQFHSMVEILSSPTRLFTDEEFLKMKKHFTSLYKTVSKLNNNRSISKKILRQLGLLNFLEEFKQLEQTKQSNMLAHQHFLDEENAKKEQIHQLQQEKESLSNACEENNNIITQLRTKLEIATRKLEEKENMVRNLEEHLESATSHVNAIETEIQSIRTRQQELESSFSTQTSILNRANNEIKNLKESRNALSDENSRYQEELEERNRTIDSLFAQDEANKAALRTKEEELSNTQSSLSEEIQKRNELGNQLNTALEEIQHLKEERQKHLEDLEKTQEEKNGLIEKIIFLKPQVESLQKEKKDLQEQLDGQNDEKTALQAKIDELKAEKEKIQPYLYLVEAKMEEEAREKALKEAKETLSLKINEAQATIETITHNDLATLLHSAVAKARQCLDDVNGDVETISNEHQSLCNSLAETSQKETDLLEEERKLAELVKALKEAKETLSLKINEAKETVETITHNNLSGLLRSAIVIAQKCLDDENSDVETITESSQTLCNTLDELAQKENDLLKEEKAKEEAQDSLKQTIRQAKEFHSGIKYEDIANELWYVISECEEIAKNAKADCSVLKRKEELLFQAVEEAKDNIRKIKELEKHEVKRSILEVFDTKEGQIINAHEFFQRPEHELIRWRRYFEESITFQRHRFLCTNCRQDVKISGRKFMRGQISFFSHLHDSDFCEIKTTTGMSKDIINARKYGLIAESERHKKLKALICNALKSRNSQQKGIYDVFEEKRINSTIPYMNWRRPDVVASLKDKNLVFELQLSTTFISVVVQRDIFYRLNNHFIIWVFNFDENTLYVDLRNLMCKDIYYANKRNIFVFDEEAQRESVKKEELVLKCNWLDPDNTWHFSPIKGNGDGILVTLDELKYDEESCKPYYFDADTPYYEIHPYVKERIQKEELSKRQMIEELMSKEKKDAELELVKRDQALKMMVENDDHIVPFKDGNKYGFKYQNVVLIPPRYSSYTEYGDKGMYKVSFNRHHGLIDKFGNELYECNYLDFHTLTNGLIIAENTSGFFMAGIGVICDRRPHDIVSVKMLSPYVTVITHNSINLDCLILNDELIFTYKSQYQFCTLNGEAIEEKGSFKKYHFTDDYSALWLYGSIDDGISKWGLFEIDGTKRNDYPYNNVSFYPDRTFAQRNGFTDIYDNIGTIIISTHYDNIIPMNNKYNQIRKDGFIGMIDNDFKEILPPKFDKINILDSCFATIQNERYGLFDPDGNQLLEHLYQVIKSVGNEKNLRCQLEDKWYLYCLETKELIKTPYDFIEKMNDTYVKVQKENFVGLLDHLGETCIPAIYSNIEQFSDGKYYSTSYHKYVFRCTKDEQICAHSAKTKDVVVPSQYPIIEWWNEDVFKVQQNSCWGLYDIHIGPITKIKYSYIGSYNSEKVKVEYIKNDITYIGHITPTGIETYSRTIDLSDNTITKLFFGKWGLFDKEDHAIIPYVSEDAIEDLGNGLYKVTLDGKCGAKNANNQFVINPIHRDIKGDENFAYLIVKTILYKREREYTYGRHYHMIDVEYNKFQLYGLDGTQNGIPSQYRGSYSSMEFGDDFIWLNNHIMSPKTFLISNDTYSSCREFEIDGWHLVANGNRKGLIDQQMKVILPCEFDIIEIWGNNLLKTRKLERYRYDTLNENNYSLYHIDGSPCPLGKLSSIGELLDGKAVVTKEGFSKGYVNADGEILVDKTETLNNEIIVKHYFGAIEVLNLDSKILLPITDAIHKIETFVPGYYKLFKKDSGYGLLSVNTPLRIECKYLTINLWTPNILILSFLTTPSSPDRASYDYNSSYGIKQSPEAQTNYKFLTLDGTMTSQYSYSKIGELIDGKAKAIRGGIQGMLNEKGIEVFDEEVQLNDNLKKKRTFGLWGVVNEESKQILPPFFTDISLYGNDKLLVFYDGELRQDVSEPKGYQLFDLTGRKILNFNFDKIEKDENGNYSIYKDSVCALYGLDFNLLISFDAGYKSVKNWNNNLYLAQKVEKSFYNTITYFQIIDEKGIAVSDIKYSHIGELIDGKAEATRGSSQGMLNDKGIETFDSEIQLNDKLKARRRFSLWEVVDNGNQQILPPSFREISLFDNNKLLASTYTYNEISSYQLFDLTGKKLLDFSFNKIEKCDNGNYSVYLNYKCALYDSNLNLLISFDAGYMSIKHWYDNMYTAQKYEKVGYNRYNKYFHIISNKGVVISKNNYSKIDELIDGKAKVILDDKIGYINNKCEEITVTKESMGEWSIKEFFEKYTILEGQEAIYDNLYKATFISDKLVQIQKTKSSKLSLYSIAERRERERKYTSIASMIDGAADAVDENNLRGRIDSDGNELYEIFELKNAVVAKRKFSRYTVYENDNVLLSEIVAVSLWGDNFLKVTNKEGEIQLYSLDKKKYMGFSFNDLSELKDGKAVAQKNKATGVVKQNGIIQPDEDITICPTMHKIKAFGSWYIVDQDYRGLTNKVALEIGSYKGKFIWFNGSKCERLELKAPKPVTVQGEYYDQTSANLIYSVGGHHVRIQKKVLKLEGKSISEYIKEHKKLEIIICHIQSYRNWYNTKTTVYGKPFSLLESKKALPPYEIDQIVKGKVHKIQPFGIRVKTIDGRVTLIHKSRLAEIGHRDTIFEKGNPITLKKIGYDETHKCDIWNIISKEHQ